MHSQTSRRFTAFEKLIQKNFLEARKFLKEHLDIIVTSEDKGKITVLMSKLEYDAKMKALLDEKSTYTILDPTKQICNCNEIIHILVPPTQNAD